MAEDAGADLVLDDNLNTAFEQLRERQHALQDASTYKGVLAAIQLMAEGPEREQRVLDDRFEELAVRECRINALHDHVEKMKTIKSMIIQVENVDEKSNALRQRYLRVVLRIREHICECELKIGSTGERDKFLYRFVNSLEQDTEDKVGKLSEGQRYREALKQVRIPDPFIPNIDTPRIWWASLHDYFEFHALNTKEQILTIRRLLPHKFQETIWSTLENRPHGMTYHPDTFKYVKDQYFDWFDTIRHEEQAAHKLENLLMASQGDALENLMVFYNEFVNLRVLSKCERPGALAAKMFLNKLNPNACPHFMKDMRNHFPWNTGTPETMLAHAKTLLLNAHAVDLAIAEYNDISNKNVSTHDNVHEQNLECYESFTDESSCEELDDAEDSMVDEESTEEEESHEEEDFDEEYENIQSNTREDSVDTPNEKMNENNKRAYHNDMKSEDSQQTKRMKTQPIQESKGENDTITTPVKDRRVGHTPTDRCMIHPDRFHTNERCFLQHPEIAPWSKNGSGNKLQK